ncbi:MAG: aminodeoxychorismate synthase component I [Micrococcales bacterium]|nr:aminodeoxychorismate synthase component I [Micrococcales bacterium]
MRLYAASLPSRVSMPDAFISLHAKDEYSFLLERESNQENRFSVMGAALSLVEDAREALKDLAGFVDNEIDLPFDFRPGLVGAFSYEGEEKFMLVDRAIVLDHQKLTAWFIGVFESEAEFNSWRDAALLRLALIGGEGAIYRHANRVETIDSSLVHSLHSDSEYLGLIEEAKEAIARGDAYQLCLTNQLTIETEVDPFAVYLRLREANPAPYLSYLKLGSTSVVSSSPEQFLRVSYSGVVSSKPIKGTRPRSADAELDKQLAEELRSNEKERAENLMIVDLMRNDLGQVSEPSDVVVAKLFEVESYATVHQLVSTITAVLKLGLDVFDAVNAAFPAGSMTGAPKQSAMSILSELEGAPRGIYSGCFGYVSLTGAADLAMTIRTIVFEEGKATIGIGGGITIDSDPEAELLETKLKARALLGALGVEQ